jgi:hypothetical protein
MLKAIVVSCAAFLALATPLLAADDAPPAAQEAPQPAAGGAAQGNADVPQSVKDACQPDYEKFCKQHAPESPEVRVCMAGAFENLSDTCVTAILDSPLADQAAQQVEAARSEADKETAAEGSAEEASAAKQTATASHVQPRKAHARKAQAAHHRPAHTAQAKRPTHTKVKVAVRLARVRPAAHKGERYAAYRGSKPRRSVSGYIRRGTSIANYYVAKYARIGFARAYR